MRSCSEASSTTSSKGSTSRSRFGSIACRGLFGYLSAQIDDHLRTPRNDLTSYLIDAEIDGVKLDAAHVIGSMALLLLAGIDTTWSAIGASIWHLAKTPADRERLVVDPDLVPVAMEELLRAYAPVTMARLVKEDMDWHGCPMKAEDWVLLSFPAANRDPSMFEDADRVIIDREINRHSAFGLGVHRCIGSHLARMELRVALETWLARFPTFSLADPDAVTLVAGTGSRSSTTADRHRLTADQRPSAARRARVGDRVGVLGLEVCARDVGQDRGRRVRQQALDLGVVVVERDDDEHGLCGLEQVAHLA